MFCVNCADAGGAARRTPPSELASRSNGTRIRCELRCRIEATRRADANFRDGFTFSEPFKVSPTRLFQSPATIGEPRACTVFSGSRPSLFHPPTPSERSQHPHFFWWLNDRLGPVGLGTRWLSHKTQGSSIYVQGGSALLNWGNTRKLRAARFSAFTNARADHREHASSLCRQVVMLSPAPAMDQ